MFTSETWIRVRYGETDRMGYVYYGTYPTYFEIGRVEALRELGFDYKDVEDSGIMLPVLDLKSKYIRPAFYDQWLLVRTTIPEMPQTRIRFLYEILNEEGTLLNSAETTLVFVDRYKERPVPCPERIGAALAAHF